MSAAVFLRPLKAKAPIDPKRLEACIMLGASDADLALMFDFTPRALQRLHGEMIQRLRAERRTQIRRLVWESAKESNPTLLTWLGKTELGWTELRVDEPSDGSMHRKPKPFDFAAFAVEFERLLAAKHREAPDNTGEGSAQADGVAEPVHPADADGETGSVSRAAGD